MNGVRVLRHILDISSGFEKKLLGMAAHTYSILFISFILLTCACSNSAVDEKMNALKIPLPFSASWFFTDSALYTSSHSEILFSSGMVGLSYIDQLDSDDSTSGGFGAGTHSNTQYASGILTLDGTENDTALSSDWTPEWDNLVGYWKMDNDWTDSRDISEVNYDGTAEDGATFTATSKIGTHAGSFDGTLDKVKTSANPLRDQSATSVTVSAWVYTDPSSWNGALDVIMDTSQANIGGFKGFMFFLDDRAGLNGTEGVMFVVKTATDVYRSARANYSITQTGWYYIAATYDGAEIHIYVNGVDKTTSDGHVSGGTGDFEPSTALNVSFGAEHNTTTYNLTGSIDDAAIWKTALSSAQIKKIYDRQSPKYRGEFTSRIFNPRGEVAWESLAWTSTLPFGKELPGESGSESSTNYPSLVGSTGATTDDNLMDSILALWHFDEASYDGTAGEVADSSGGGNNCVRVGDATTSSDGRFYRSATFDGTGDYLNCGATDELEGIANLTISAWVKFDSITDWDRVFTKAFDANNSFGITVASNDYYVLMGDGANSYGSTTDDSVKVGKWEHIVMVFDGAGVDDAAKLKFYLNGAEKVLNYVNTPIPALTLASSAASFYIGEHPTNSNPMDGNIDEIAIWTRSLHADEVAQLFRRGANRVNFQVRACDDSACSGESWMGPDGTSLTYFTELHNNASIDASGYPDGAVQTGTPTVTYSDFSDAGLTVSDNQYFQYKVVLESDDEAVAATYPELVTVMPGPNHYPVLSYVQNKNGVTFGEVKTFAAVAGAGNQGTTTFQLSSDKQSWYYYNGTAWVTATSATDANQTSSASTINNGISSFHSAAESGTFYFRAFLNSTAGTQQCTLANVSLAALMK